jgi:hypothetical protein
MGAATVTNTDNKEETSGAVTVKGEVPAGNVLSVNIENILENAEITIKRFEIQEANRHEQSNTIHQDNVAQKESLAYYYNSKESEIQTSKTITVGSKENQQQEGSVYSSDVAAASLVRGNNISVNVDAPEAPELANVNQVSTDQIWKGSLPNTTIATDGATSEYSFGITARDGAGEYSIAANAGENFSIVNAGGTGDLEVSDLNTSNSVEEANPQTPVDKTGERRKGSPATRTAPYRPRNLNNFKTSVPQNTPLNGDSKKASGQKPETSRKNEDPSTSADQEVDNGTGDPTPDPKKTQPDDDPKKASGGRPKPKRKGGGGTNAGVRKKPKPSPDPDPIKDPTSDPTQSRCEGVDFKNLTSLEKQRVKETLSYFGIDPEQSLKNESETLEAAITKQPDGSTEIEIKDIQKNIQGKDDKGTWTKLSIKETGGVYEIKLTGEPTQSGDPVPCLEFIANKSDTEDVRNAFAKIGEILEDRNETPPETNAKLVKDILHNSSKSGVSLKSIENLNLKGLNFLEKKGVFDLSDVTIKNCTFEDCFWKIKGENLKVGNCTFKGGLVHAKCSNSCFLNIDAKGLKLEGRWENSLITVKNGADKINACGITEEGALPIVLATDMKIDGNTTVGQFIMPEAGKEFSSKAAVAKILSKIEGMDQTESEAFRTELENKLTGFTYNTGVLSENPSGYWGVLRAASQDIPDNGPVVYDPKTYLDALTEAGLAKSDVVFMSSNNTYETIYRVGRTPIWIDKDNKGDTIYKIMRKGKWTPISWEEFYKSLSQAA